MKKLYLIAMLLLASLPLFAAHVDPVTAHKAASTFMNNNGGKITQLADLSKEVGFPNLYIFNASQGFVVMSADDCVKPILGYSLTGQFKADDMPENIHFWLQGYNDQIQYAIDNHLTASSETAQQWKELKEGVVHAAKADPVIGPLIQTTWDQENPYNLYCPNNSMTGCVATAMAQIMNYWGYPSHGMGMHSYIPKNHPEYGTLTEIFNEVSYDWANMPNALTSSSPTIEQQAVATLMYHCGISVEMDYSPSSSGAASASVPSALVNYFGYSNDMQFIYKEDCTDAQWDNLLKTELNANHPVYYSGSHASGGHAFVCDGYNTDNYYHFNWGWSGYQDGYWAIGALNPGSGGAGSGSGTYNLDNGIVIGCLPPAPSAASAPTNLAFTLDDNDLTLTWDAASGADSYNIYENSSSIPIGTTTSTSFIAENIHHGTNLFFVRSVDASGNLSLSSNGVLVTLSYPAPIVDDLAATVSGDQANLNWTAPEWCFPETESALLSYGSGVHQGSTGGTAGTYNLYWGHQYLAGDLASVAGDLIYKVAFFAQRCGTYQLLLYQGTASDLPSTMVLNKTFIATELGWFDIELDLPVAIDATQDLWVFLYDPEAKDYPITYCGFTDNDRGAYYSYDPYNPMIGLAKMTGKAFLIKTFLTDGIYTYNLYQDGVKIADNLTGTTYTATLNDNAANLFTLKTNYYGGETAHSNKAGFAKGTASIGTLEMDGNDRLTLTENSKLTVTGTLSNANAANLILENGAQLIHNTNGVNATMKKNIEPYVGGNDNWYLITNPTTSAITPSAENGFLNGTAGSNSFDLFYYNETDFTWMNYEVTPFDLNPAQGYLYGNGQTEGTTLRFEGEVQPSHSSIPSGTLSFGSSILKGVNLIGNPFVCNATVDRDYYIIDETTSHVILAAADRTVSPCEAILVQAVSDSDFVTFSKAGTSKGETSSSALDIILTQGTITIDRIRVRNTEGNDLEKFNLDPNHTQFFIHHNDKDLAVTSTKTTETLPLQFKAHEDGIYTLAVEQGTSEFDYLHLIDHLIGADIDLLVTPSYTFEAKTHHYPSRFQLVFSEDAMSHPDEDDFDLVDGNCEILDMTGRVVATDRYTQLAPGIYIVRTTNGNNIKTKKIIIR